MGMVDVTMIIVDIGSNRHSGHSDNRCGHR